MKKRVVLYTKLFFIFLISFVSASLLNNEVFVANSPQIRDNLGAHIASRFQQIPQEGVNIAGLFMTNDQKNQQKDQLAEGLSGENAPELPAMQRVTTGVYAGERDESQYLMILEEERQYKQYFVTIDGRQVIVEVPVDREVDPVELENHLREIGE